MDTEEDRLRLVVMGDARVGKSAILTRFLYNTVKVCLRAYDLHLSTPVILVIPRLSTAQLWRICTPRISSLGPAVLRLTFLIQLEMTRWVDSGCGCVQKYLFSSGCHTVASTIIKYITTRKAYSQFNKTRLIYYYVTTN